MLKPTAASDNPRVLVVDDNANWVRSLVIQFARASIKAEGVNDPAKVLGWTKPQQFSDFDTIFLDMRLGLTEDGSPISAADLLLHIMTYCPTAKVVVFTQKEVSVEECVRCIQFGALGFIPKMSKIDHFVLVANVYRKLADDGQAYEERIGALWVELNKQENPAKGRHLEMLTTNLLNSITGFRVISNNTLAFSGEIDLTVENLCKHDFWQILKSYHLLVECKNLKGTAQQEVFNVLARKVAGKVGCKVGILVSWNGVSKGFRQLQGAEADPVKIFTLDRSDLEQLVRRTPDARELYLRNTFERQL
jgi:ActR/RegA family two-component response regulator